MSGMLLPLLLLLLLPLLLLQPLLPLQWLSLWPLPLPLLPLLQLLLSPPLSLLPLPSLFFRPLQSSCAGVPWPAAPGGSHSCTLRQQNQMGASCPQLRCWSA